MICCHGRQSLAKRKVFVDNDLTRLRVSIDKTINVD